MNMDNMHFKDLFSFSRREKRGIFTLLVILILLIFFRANLHLFFPREDTTIDRKFISEVEAFLQSGNSENREKTVPSAKYNREDSKAKNTLRSLFYFDPNTITDKEWKNLGISEGQLKVINNYKRSGGKFFEKEDLKKIYVINEETYSQLEKYIKIERKSPEPEKKTETSKEAIPVIEINTADTFRLAMLRGIGPAYARRICKYRDLLGGFSSKNQLKEVYGISDELVSLIDSTIRVDKQKIRKIDVNKAKFAELIRHPYLNEYQTKAIVSYRQFKRRINDLQELVSNNILDEETYIRMRPYLKIGDE